MKRAIAVILSCLLIAPPASAGQKRGTPIDWQHARKLKAGTDIVLTVTGGESTTVRLLFADDTMIVTLKPTAPKLPGGVERLLFEVGARWPGIVNAGATYNDGRLRLSEGALFDRDKKLADLADVVQQTPRGGVQELAEAPHSHVGRNILVALGVMVGVLILVVGLVTGFQPD